MCHPFNPTNHGTRTIEINLSRSFSIYLHTTTSQNRNMSLIDGGGGGGGVLASARYGKDKVRVFRVVRDATSGVHDVVEYNVTVLVEGAIETRYGPPSAA